MSASILVVKTAIRGYHVYHVYQTVWELCIGDAFFVLHEERNVPDNHAMAVYGDENPGMIVGHLPWEISTILQGTKARSLEK